MKRPDGDAVGPPSCSRCSAAQLPSCSAVRLRGVVPLDLLLPALLVAGEQPLPGGLVDLGPQAAVGAGAVGAAPADREQRDEEERELPDPLLDAVGRRVAAAAADEVEH